MVLVAIVALASGVARAQDGRIEASVGLGRLGGASLGRADAALTTGGGGTFRLFATDTHLESATFAAASIGWRFSPLLGIDVRGTYGRPALRVHLGDDAEGAAPADASERLREYALDALLVVHPSRWRIGARAALFASLGAGYVRHLHEGESLADDGRRYLVGGGIKYELSGPVGPAAAAGLRLDGGLAVRSGLQVLDEGAHATPIVAGSFFLRF